MFWGVTLMPGQPCTKVLDKTVCLSMAALESRQTVGSGFTQVVIQAGGAEHLLCTLMSGVIFQQYMNVTLSEGEKVTLSVEGSGMVHLTGFTIQSDDNRVAYDSNVGDEDDYYDDEPIEGEQFTVKMEDTRDLSGDWESNSDVPVSSEASYSEHPPHVIAISDSEPVEPNQMEFGWQKEPEAPMLPAQTNYHEQQAIASLDLQGNSGQIPLVSPTQKHISSIRNHDHLHSSQFLPTVDLRRTTSLRITPHTPGDGKNRMKILKPKAASAHRAEAEAIEARRRRWRLAKREQRKKIKEKVPGTIDKFYYMSNSGEFYTGTPGNTPGTSSSAGFQSPQIGVGGGGGDEPVEDIYQITATPSKDHQANIKTELNNFEGTTALQT